MAYALDLALDIPPRWGYLICALVVIPLVTHGRVGHQPPAADHATALAGPAAAAFRGRAVARAAGLCRCTAPCWSTLGHGRLRVAATLVRR